MNPQNPKNVTAAVAVGKLATPSVKEEVARTRVAISAGDGVIAQRDAEKLLATVDARERALVLNALAELHAANGDALALGRVAAEARS